MDHGFEPKINLARANDLRYVTRIIRLQESNLNALILEKSLGLSQVQRSVIRRGVPFVQGQSMISKRLQKQRASQPVRQESDLVGRHVGAAIQSIPPILRALKEGLGKEACSFAAITLIKFVTVYSQRAQQSKSHAQPDSPLGGEIGV